jgi:hypothetical protein
MVWYGGKIMSKEITHVTYGAGLGSMLAITISYSLNQSFWWAFLHGIFGWFYLIYYGLGFTE